MTALTVTSDDLASYFGQEVDEDRADFFLDLVMTQAATIVSPVPEAAKAVILRAAARGYQNPTGGSSELVGPYQFSTPMGDILLTKSDRAALRRAGGGGGAFSFDQLAITGTNDDDDYPSVRFPDA